MKCEHCGKEFVPVDIEFDGHYLKAWICDCKSEYEISDDDRNKIWDKQREKLGFDERDTWCLHSRISSYVLPRLKLFKQLNNGRPSSFDTFEEWDEALDKMIKSFEISASIFESRLPYEELYTEEGQKMYKEGMELFKEYFLDLWW